MSKARGVVAAGDSESRASLQMLEKEFSTETLPAGTQPLDNLGVPPREQAVAIPVVTAELLHSSVFGGRWHGGGYPQQ
jgi:hypothetical protein